jgi:ketosteroid isomerase-like protein
VSESPNVALVRRALALFNAGDREALRQISQPDFHLDLTARVMNPDTYEGQDGIDRMQEELREVWDSMQLEPLEFRAGGDAVLVRIRSRFVGRGSGISLDSEVSHVWTVREGLVASVKLFTDHDEARRFAGL